MAPFYLSDLLTFVNVISNRNTRQTDLNLLHLPFARTNYYQKSFSEYGPVIWNSLPFATRAIDIYETICCKLFVIVTNYLEMRILADDLMYVLLNKQIYSLASYILLFDWAPWEISIILNGLPFYFQFMYTVLFVCI